MPKTRKISGRKRQTRKRKMRKGTRRMGGGLTRMNYTHEDKLVMEGIFNQMKLFRDGECNKSKITVIAGHEAKTALQKTITKLEIRIDDESIAKKGAKLFIKGWQKFQGSKEKASKSSTVKFLKELLTNGEATREDCELAGFAHRLNEMYKFDDEGMNFERILKGQ